MGDRCMAELYTSVKGLPKTNEVIDGLRADFSGLENLAKVVDGVLRRLELSTAVQGNISAVRSGHISMHQFDVDFAQLVRMQLGKVLGIMRARAVEKAAKAGAGSAATAVLRRMYKDSFTANINIAGHRGRISSRSRVVPGPNGGKSGIRRDRTVKPRTKKLREYYGPDRDFILRIFSNGRDEFRATSDGPVGRGSKATYGRRGAMVPRWDFVHSMQSDMQQAAQQLGIDLTQWVEEFIETKFTE